MIEAKELRIGNWIYDSEENNNFQVEEIKNINGFHYTCYRKKSIKALRVEGLTLTEDILLKCGFQYCGDREWIVKKILDNSEICFSLMEEFVTDNFGIYKADDDMNNGGWFYPKKTLYLHQVQNLYWCLCGEELEIKL